MFEYRVFISHNKKDRAIAQKIGAHLINHHIDVWFDEWSLYAGDSLTDSIGKGIESSNVFLLLSSSNSVESPWVREELKVALNKRREDSTFRIITIQLEECPINPFLTDYLWIDFTNHRKFKSMISQLIISILQIDKKPKSFDIGTKFYLHNLHYKIKFEGARGSKANVIETYDMSPVKNMKHLTKLIYHSGGLVDKKFFAIDPDFDSKIKTLEKTTALERLQISFSPELLEGNRYKFAFAHTIIDNFFNDDEFVYYTIESDTKKIEFDIEFGPECPARSFTVLKRVGQTEKALNSLSGTLKFHFEDILPNLHETYVFRWSWVKSEPPI